MGHQREKGGKCPISAAAWAYIRLKSLQHKEVILPRTWRTQEVIGLIRLVSVHPSSQPHNFPSSQTSAAKTSCLSTR